jgi:3-methylcrotonyl-CoA carboxylase alpha subunit
VRLRVLVGEGERVIEVTRLRGDRFRIVTAGGTMEVVARAGPGGELRFAGEWGSRGAIGMARGRARQIWVEGKTFPYEIVSGSRASRARDQDLTSPAPGVVAEILAQPGAAVRKGEKLVVLESMKMFFPVVAPRDGKVERILCARGETVDAGVPLVEMAAEPEEA